MKKTILSLTFTITFAFICIAQISLYPNYIFTDLNHIAVSGNNIFCVGSCGGAQISVDNGITWDIFELDDNSAIRDLQIRPDTDGKEAYFYNSNGLYTIDIDKTVSALNTTPLNAFGNIMGMQIDEEYIYIISTGAIHKSIHTTMEWQFVTEITYDIPYTINTTSISPNNIYIASREGHVFKSNKTTGEYLELGNLGDRINKLEMATNQVGYLTRSNALGPYKTIDGGTTWTEITNWPENNPVYVYNENVILTSNTNRYFVSTDGGTTSTSYYSIRDDINIGLINSVMFTEDGTIYMVGGSSTVIRSNDFGESYENLLPSVRTRLYNIDISGSSGIASGYGAILTSNDSGNNWSQFNTEDIQDINEAIIIDEAKYAIATDNGVVIVNSDNIESTAGSSAYRIYSSADNSYFIAAMQIGGSHVLSKSIDNGLTWSNRIFNDDYFGKIKVDPQGILYTISGAGRYMKSDDDGETWEEVTLPITDYVLDMVIHNGVELYSIGGTLYESLDQGASVSEIASGYLLSNLHILNEDHYTYTTGSNSLTTIREKRSGSNIFSTVAQSCGSSFGSYNNGNGEIWYSKEGGHIIKYNFDMPTSAFEIENQALPIYPNPILSGEMLHIDNLTQYSSISIINQIGKKLIKIKSSDRNTTISTKSLAPGNYYIVITDTRQQNTMKLIIQ